jgi:hypothetical protein
MANMCGCRYSRKISQVIHCPMHGAAGDLLGALVDLLERAESVNESHSGEYDPDLFSASLLAKASSALARARGRS